MDEQIGDWYRDASAQTLGQRFETPVKCIPLRSLETEW